MAGLGLGTGCKEKEPDKNEQASVSNEKADYTIRIGTGLLEVGPQYIISTTTYNGQFPRLGQYLYRQHRQPLFQGHLCTA